MTKKAEENWPLRVSSREPAVQPARAPAPAMPPVENGEDPYAALRRDTAQSAKQVLGADDVDPAIIEEMLASELKIPKQVREGLIAAGIPSIYHSVRLDRMGVAGEKVRVWLARNKERMRRRGMGLVLVSSVDHRESLNVFFLAAKAVYLMGMGVYVTTVTDDYDTVTGSPGSDPAAQELAKNCRVLFLLDAYKPEDPNGCPLNHRERARLEGVLNRRMTAGLPTVMLVDQELEPDHGWWSNTFVLLMRTHCDRILL